MVRMLAFLMSFLVVFFVVMSKVVRVLRQEGNSSPRVFSIHRMAAAIQNEIRSQRNQNPVAGFERLSCGVSKLDPFHVTVMWFVNELPALVVYIPRPAPASLNHPYIQHPAPYRRSADRLRKPDFQSMMIFVVIVGTKQLPRLFLRIGMPVAPIDSSYRCQIVQTDRALHSVVNVIRMERMSGNEALNSREE